MRHNNCKINLFVTGFLLFSLSEVFAAKPGKVTSQSKLTTDLLTTTTFVPTTEFLQVRRYQQLDFVDGLKSCKNVSSNHACKNLCEMLKKSHQKSSSVPNNTPYWIAGSIMAILTLTSIVLCFKTCELKQDHSEEMDLSGLSRKEQLKQILLAQPDPDADPSKFKKQGGVVIATNLDHAFKKKCRDKKDIELGDVEYDEADNEQYDFGEEYDQFETTRTDQSKMRSNSKSKSKSKSKSESAGK
ncbi:unnamed protein product [Caenorhabditis nigoni]